MRVAIDGSALADGSGDRGVGTYLKNVLRGLAARDDVELLVLAPQGATLPDAVTRVPVRRVSHHRLGPVLHDWLLPREIQRLEADVFHSPAFSPPRRCPVPYVQTLHDLTPLVFAHPLLTRDAARWRRRAPALRRADAVIADSASSAEQGVRLLGLDAARVHVVHLGVDPVFTPAPGLGPDREAPYVLSVSSWGPHKGFREAAQVLDRLVEAGLPHRLRVLGRQDPWMRAHLEEDLATARHRDRIDVVGWVPDLAAQYHAADALLVTSRAEGFGLPAAEAIACGTPVVAFDNTSLPEVVGGAGVLVPDGDVVAFADAVVDVLTTPGRRAELVEAALAEAARFRWSDAVQAHHDVYASVARS